MLKFLASSMLYRRLGRAIPNPILRTIAIAGVGMAASRFAARRAARKGTLAPPTGRRLHGDVAAS